MKLPSVPPRIGDTPEPRARSDVDSEADAPRLSPARSLIRFFYRLWTGDLPLSQVFWHDMLVVGTAVNIAAMGLAFLAVALGASTPVGIAIHLSPVPYNILLVASVWRRAGVERSNWSALAQVGALIWLVIAFVI